MNAMRCWLVLAVSPPRCANKNADSTSPITLNENERIHYAGQS